MNTIPWCANVYLTLVEVMILHIFYRLRYYELQTKIYITSRNKIGFCQCVNYYDNFLLLCWFSNMIYSYNKGFQHRGAANNLWGRVYCRINRHQDFKTFFLLAHCCTYCNFLSQCQSFETSIYCKMLILFSTIWISFLKVLCAVAYLVLESWRGNKKHCYKVLSSQSDFSVWL